MLFVALWHLLQVKAPNLLPAKEQVKAAIVGGRTEGHFLAAKGLTHVKEMSLEFDLAFGSHQADKILRKVLNFRQSGRHGSLAGLIATSRHPKLKCLVRPLGIVTVSELIEAFLAMRQMPPGRRLVEHFGLHATMETLFFTLGLGVG